MLEQPPDTNRFYVPLRETAGALSLRLFRDRGGDRCAVGFTSAGRLTELLGPDQRFYRLSERSVRALARERGVTELIVDPRLVAAPVREVVPDSAPESAPDPARESVRVSEPVRVSVTDSVREPVRPPEPVRAPEPVRVPAATRVSRRVQALRATWSGPSTGVLTVSAITGAAAVAMEVLK